MAGQSAPAAVRPVEVSDAVWLGAAGLAYLAPRLAGFGPGLPHPCGPCDRARVPGFDRVAIRAGTPTAGTLSDIGLVVSVLGPLIDLGHQGDEGRARAAGVALSVGWAIAATELLKNTVRRPRPGLYLDPVPAAARASRDSRRSFPSGHTAAAFAAAASYWWSRRALSGTDAPEAWVPWGLALGTGVMRVTAGRHFPSDVVGGIVVGVVSAILVREVRL